MEEDKKAIFCFKNVKAQGTDDIQAKLIKHGCL